jgi:acetoin utilization deacetylase AcuC-like enzyme
LEKLVFYYPQGHEAHYSPGHPERPERITVLRRALQAAGWWDAYPRLDPLDLTEEFLVQVHSRLYLEHLQAACRRAASLDADTYTTPESWRLALNAAGGAAAVAQAVWQGDAQRGLALTRPPGHHATVQRGMGFCLLNNIALAAQFLLTPSANITKVARKLAIVDLDLHHGNGTQDIFWRRSDVFFISTHQSPLYPGSGRLDEIGDGEGRGYNANVPLPPFTGDQGFGAVMETFILPLLDRYAPQMILVSFGFDTHWRDPLGNLSLSAGKYGELIRWLVEWADVNCEGKIALFLEGGYDLEAGAACIQAITAALLGEEWQDPIGPAPQAETNSWRSVLKAAQRIWDLPVDE